VVITRPGRKSWPLQASARSGHEALAPNPASRTLVWSRRWRFWNGSGVWPSHGSPTSASVWIGADVTRLWPYPSPSVLACLHLLARRTRYAIRLPALESVPVSLPVVRLATSLRTVRHRTGSTPTRADLLEPSSQQTRLPLGFGCHRRHPLRKDASRLRPRPAFATTGTRTSARSTQRAEGFHGRGHECAGRRP
jgi:hypothetical protein